MKPANYAPVYAAALYPQWTEIVREHGYALAVHGSLARDFDLVCIPWREDPPPSEPQVVIDAIKAVFAVKEAGGPPTAKPHGRMAYTLSIAFGECFADLSFMPCTASLPRTVDMSGSILYADNSPGSILLREARAEERAERERNAGYCAAAVLDAGCRCSSLGMKSVCAEWVPVVTPDAAPAAAPMPSDVMKEDEAP